MFDPTEDTVLGCLAECCLNSKRGLCLSAADHAGSYHWQFLVIIVSGQRITLAVL